MNSYMIKVPDLSIVLGYFVVMLGIGIYFARRMGNMHEYFGGGGRIPWWLSGISFYMTSFSAFAFVAYSQLAYKFGLAAISVFWMSSVAAFLSATFFAAKWRRAARTSALEYVEQRFSLTLRQALAWINIPLRIIDNGLKLYAIGTLISGTLGLGTEYVLASILFSGFVVFLYTFLGGLWAVMVTDFVQAVVMILAVIVLLPLSISQANGFSGIIKAAPEGFFNLTNDTFTFGYLVAWLVLVVFNYSSSWSLVQRYYSVPTDADARKVGYLVAGLQIITPPLLFLPAIAARSFLPDLSSDQVEQVYAIICRTLLPVGMIGLLISAMFAATMSTLSGEYNAIASVMTNDVYRRLILPHAKEKQLVFVGRITTVLVGMACLLVSMVLYYYPSGTSLFDMMVKVFSIFMPPIAIPMLAGLVSTRVSNRSALNGIILGMIAGLGGYLLSLLNPHFEFLTKNQFMIPFTVGATFIGLILTEFIHRPSQEEQERVREFFSSMQAQAPAMPVGSGDGKFTFTPVQVIGISVACLGLLMSSVMLFSMHEKNSLISLSVGVLMLAGGIITFRLGKNKNKEE